MSGNVPIGRLGSQLYVTKYSGLITTGYRDIDTTAQFTAGMIAKLVDDGAGNPVVTPVTAKTDAAIGIFWSDKIDAFYNVVINEAVVIASGKFINLANVNVDAASVKVTSTIGGAIKVLTTDYTVSNATKGILTSVTGAVGDTVYVSYRYRDPNKAGIDQTIANGKAAIFEGVGEIGTLIYDTSVDYTLGGAVYFNTSALPTSAGTAGTHTKIGVVTKVPSASDPELRIKVTL